ncbi:MAG TPA: hypothetical protein DD656_06685 [Alphaproteobacteria bacterium]|nr:hypothetical protein [Paracoccaceae bacterium]HBQ23404.1 hypothetical protein [Alphaproteobacteria bacterium]
MFLAEAFQFRQASQDRKGRLGGLVGGGADVVPMGLYGMVFGVGLKSATQNLRKERYCPGEHKLR